jgi:hypothetical protein
MEDSTWMLRKSILPSAPARYKAGSAKRGAIMLHRFAIRPLRASTRKTMINLGSSQCSAETRVSRALVTGPIADAGVGKETKGGQSAGD